MDRQVTPTRWDESESEEEEPKEEKPKEEKPPHDTAPEDRTSNRDFFTCGADLDFSTDVTRYIKNNILHSTANLKSAHPFKYTRTRNIFYGFSDDGSMYDGIFVATFIRFRNLGRTYGTSENSSHQGTTQQHWESWRY